MVSADIQGRQMTAAALANLGAAGKRAAPLLLEDRETSVRLLAAEAMGSPTRAKKSSGRRDNRM